MKLPLSAPFFVTIGQLSFFFFLNQYLNLSFFPGAPPDSVEVCLFLKMMNKHRRFLISRLSLDVFIVAAVQQSARKLRWRIPVAYLCKRPPPHPHPPLSHTHIPRHMQKPIHLRHPRLPPPLHVLAPSICFYAASACEKPVKTPVSSPSHHICERFPSQMFMVCWNDRMRFRAKFVAILLKRNWFLIYPPKPDLVLLGKENKKRPGRIWHSVANAREQRLSTALFTTAPK